MKEFRSDPFEGTAREILRGSRWKFSRSGRPRQQDRWEALPKVSCFQYAQTMATGTPLLTLEEFQRRYAGQDTVYEYWLGEAVPRVGHITLHGMTQKVAAR